MVTEEGFVVKHTLCFTLLAIALLSFFLIQPPVSAQQRIFDLEEHDQTVTFLGGHEGDQVTYTFDLDLPDLGPSFSHTIAHGDVNGDNVQDLIIGAPLSNHKNSAIHWYYIT
jgi:hypothetical protein